MPTNLNRVIFTEEMRKDYTILCPQMSPIHFDLLEPAFRSCGYNFEVLDNDNRHSVDIGLKYVNNDACYPSLCVVGQIMDALLSGKYDLHKVAVVITQTGRRLPCNQLHRFHPPCIGKSRYGIHSGRFHQHGRH